MLPKSAVTLEERREIDARVLITLFLLLDTAILEIPSIHEYFSYVNQFEPFSFLALAQVNGS